MRSTNFWGDLTGARVLVAGAWVTGASAARVLAELGAEVTITDSLPSQLAATMVPSAVRLVAGLAAQRTGVPVIGDVTLARCVGVAASAVVQG